MMDSTKWQLCEEYLLQISELVEYTRDAESKEQLSRLAEKIVRCQSLQSRLEQEDQRLKKDYLVLLR